MVFSSLGIYWPLTTKHPSFLQSVFDLPSSGAPTESSTTYTYCAAESRLRYFFLKCQVSLDLKPTFAAASLNSAQNPFLTFILLNQGAASSPTLLPSNWLFHNRKSSLMSKPFSLPGALQWILLWEQKTCWFYTHWQSFNSSLTKWYKK